MNDLARPTLVMRHVVKRAGVLVAIALVVGAIAFVIRTSADDQWEATAKVAFVEDTRFDYVEAERDRLVGLVDERTQTLLAADDVLSITFDRPNRETFLDVVVRAHDPSRASDVANELADRIVAADRDVRSASLTIELEARIAQLADIDADLREQQEQIAEQTEREAFAEANRFEGDTAQVEALTIELRTAQDALFLAIRDRNALSTRKVVVEDRLAELEVLLATTEAETRVVRPALVPQSPSGPSALTVAFVAAVSALAIGALVLALAFPEHEA